MPELFEKAFRNAHRVSSSQTDTIKLCERKWGFEKLDGLPRPPNEFAQIGLDAHEVLELWQEKGHQIDLTTPIGMIVAPGLKFLPQPGSHRTEHDFVFDTGRVVFHGRMDLRGPADASVQTVWDHKTTGSFNWLKTPQFLRKDAQAVIYGKAADIEARSKGLVWGQTLERIELNWVYYLRNPNRPRSRKVQLNVIYNESVSWPSCPDNVRPEHFGVMTLGELEERFAEIEEIGIKILTYYQQKPKAMDLPYNATACSAYGGCPYQDNPCTLTLGERIRAMEAQEGSKNLSFAEKIRQNLYAAGKQGAQGSEQGAEQTATATAPAADPIPPVPVTEEGQPAAPQQPTSPAPPPGLASLGAAAPAATGGEAAAAPATPPATQPTASAPATEPAQVNPPEKGKGVDPDGPAISATQAVGGALRIEMIKDAMRALVQARVYSVDDNRYEAKIANQAVKLADMTLAAAAAKK